MNDNSDVTPAYEDFLPGARRPRSWTKELINALEDGIPRRVEPPRVDAKVASMRQAITSMARRMSIPIVTRVFGAELWVCRLRPEDVPPPVVRESDPELGRALIRALRGEGYDVDDEEVSA